VNEEDWPGPGGPRLKAFERRVFGLLGGAFGGMVIGAIIGLARGGTTYPEIWPWAAGTAFVLAVSGLAWPRPMLAVFSLLRIFG
jgi:hypothetical protein